MSAERLQTIRQKGTTAEGYSAVIKLQKNDQLTGVLTDRKSIAIDTDLEIAPFILGLLRQGA